MDTRIHTTKLTFKHFVVATMDGTTFASARDAHNRVHNFLISRYGDVKAQVNGHFELITGDYATYIKNRAEFYYTIAPVYRIRSIDFN